MRSIRASMRALNAYALAHPTKDGAVQSITRTLKLKVDAPEGSELQAALNKELSGYETIRRKALDELEKFSWSEFFFIDDLHQAKFTPRYSEELFRIIENRYSQNLPTFITCQVPGDALVSKLTADNPQLREIAEAIVRRIRDMCEPIDFDAK